MAADPTSLNGLLYSLGVALDDAHRGTTDAPGGSTSSQFISTDLVGGLADELKGAEVWFEDTTGMTGRNPFKVTASNQTSGLVTLNHPYGAAAPVAGLSFVAQNLGSDGTPHQKKLEAIFKALRDIGAWQRVGPFTITPDTTTYLHPLPPELDAIDMLEYVDGSDLATLLPASLYSGGLNAQANTVYIPMFFPDGTLRAWGYSNFSQPASAVAADFAVPVANVNETDVVTRAAAYIRQFKLSRYEQANAANLLQFNERRTRQTPPPGAIVLRR